ncbi:MAG: sigma 54-interacting transcriptional regulator [Desulfobacterales bacterium]
MTADDKSTWPERMNAGAITPETFVNNPFIALGLLDRQLRFVWANSEMATYSGRPVEKMMGKQFSVLFRQFSSEIEDKFAIVLETGKPVMLEICISLIKESDKPLLFLVSYYPVIDAAGGVKHVFCLIQNITDKSTAQFQFLHERSLADSIIENLPEQFFIVDREGRFLRWNKKFEKFTGYSTQEISAINIFELFSPNEEGKFWERFDRFFETGSGYYESDMILKNGNRIPILLSGVIQEIDGKPCLIGLGVQTLNRNIEEKKILLLSLNKLKQTKNRLEMENEYLREELALRYHHNEIIGQSNPIKKVLRQIEQVAGTDSTVLLLGETGTGKGVLARAIHHLSKRKAHPMVEVNCAALPAGLIENELFGHEKGAFTGAVSRQIGRFEIADGSTIFLDEISELPLELQAKLLRVLQEGKFERLGSWDTVAVNARVIAASNKDLKKAVKTGSFREDLYYRLNVFPISVPPLRRRKEDIPLLVRSFIDEFQAAMGKTIKHIPDQAMQRLKRYPWNGNVRELRNIIERAVILTNGPVLEIDLPRADRSETDDPLTLEALERNHIEKVLKKTGGKIRGENGAAQILGLKPSTLESRMKKLGVNRTNLPS